MQNKTAQTARLMAGMQLSTAEWLAVGIRRGWLGQSTPKAKTAQTSNDIHVNRIMQDSGEKRKTQRSIQDAIASLTQALSSGEQEGMTDLLGPLQALVGQLKPIQQAVSDRTEKNFGGMQQEKQDFGGLADQFRGDARERQRREQTMHKMPQTPQI